MGLAIGLAAAGAAVIILFTVVMPHHRISGMKRGEEIWGPAVFFGAPVVLLIILVLVGD
jgi:hypothetical protein